VGLLAILRNFDQPADDALKEKKKDENVQNNVRSAYNGIPMFLQKRITQ
jgi:hypothetical protein